MEPSGSRDSPIQFPASQTIHHHPYFTPHEVDILSEQQRGKMSITQEDRARQQACGFIEAIGARVGFPRRTIATAQNLYHRFHLFFARKDFNYHDVTLAALYVSTKMHDTLKKPRELLMVSYAVRFPDQAAKSKSIAGEVDMDPAVVEADRQRLLAVERLILETICFNFTSRMPFPYVIKIAREFRASKKLTKFAWRLTIDSQRTLAPLQYPPHVVAIACLSLAALLASFEKGPTQPQPDYATDHEIAAMLRQHGPWERKFQAYVEDLELIIHSILDLLIAAAAQNPSASASPSTPSSPSSYSSSFPSSSSRNSLNPSSSHPHLAPPPRPSPYSSDQLMRLKISLRETEHGPRDRTPLLGGGDGGSEGVKEILKKGGASALGKNEGTVRFLFGPNGAHS